MKYILFIFFPLLVISFFYSIYQSLEKDRLRFSEINRKGTIAESEKNKKLLEACNHFPKDGYLKTDSGYYFDLFKFLKFIERERPEFREQVEQRPYQALWQYFSFKLNEDNECVIYLFEKFLSWDEKNNNIKNIKEVVNYNVNYRGGLYDLVSGGNTLKLIKNPLVIGVGLNKRDLRNKKNITDYSKIRWSRWISRTENIYGEYILLPLTSYPDIKIPFEDIEVKQGYINTDVLQPNITFVYEGYNNSGVSYTFQCNQIIWRGLPKDKKLPIKNLLNVSLPKKSERCTASTGSINDAIYRDYGYVRPNFGTDALKDLKPILEQSVKFSDQFITKEKIR